MGESGTKRIILPAAIIIAGFAAIVGLSQHIEGSRPPLPDGFADSDLAMNGSRLKGFAMGTEGLIADWYYMRSLQYLGEKVIKHEGNLDLNDLRALNPRLLYPLLENATDLDPHYIAAYSFGAMLLPAIDPEQAIDLGSKGVANNPGEWRLFQYLGYTHWRLGDYEKAAAVFEKGSEIEGSSGFMKLMTAAMRTKGGSRVTARAMYGEMVTNSDDEQVRIAARSHLQELDSLDERDAIDKVLVDFKEKNGRCAAGLVEILPILIRVELPNGRVFRVDATRRLVDPAGVPYLLDQAECRVASNLKRTAPPTN